MKKHECYIMCPKNSKALSDEISHTKTFYNSKDDKICDRHVFYTKGCSQ